MIYAIGDIHGHLELLLQAHILIAEDMSEHGEKSAPVVHLGDIVDRGPDSKGVLDFLIDGCAAGRNWIVLRGNHDQLFLDFLNGGDGTDPHLTKGMTWHSRVMGGAATLSSYAGEKRVIERKSSYENRARKSVPVSHRDFLGRLPYWHDTEDVLFVHAGIRPGFPMDAQDEDDLMWIRNDFLFHTAAHPKLIIHGHTPVNEPTHYGNRINIDCGAGWGHSLVPVVWDQGVCYALTTEGRQQVKAPNEYYQ